MPPISLPGPEATQILVDAILAAEAPILVGDLGKTLGLGKKITAKQIGDLLAEDVAGGRVFSWVVAKKKAYWNRDPTTAARDRLLLLAGREALNEKQLEQRASAETPVITATVVKAARKQLLAEDHLRKLPGFIVSVERPFPYLELEITRLLKEFGIERRPQRIRGLLDGEGSSQQTLSVEEVAGKIFEALNRVAFAPGTTVTFYRLRQQPELADIPKEVFDQAALLLQRDRRALLSVHGHGASLPPEEQQSLVTDGLGAYYVSIYAR